jgi:flagellar protein FlgJ
VTSLASLSATGAAPGIQAASGSAKPNERAELAKAAKAFEAIFVRQLIASMRATTIGEDLTGSNAVDQFQEMADARTADSLADGGNLGIASLLLKQLDRKPVASTAEGKTAE